MNMKEITAIAKTIGIKTSKLKKVNLVRVIQRTEGNFDCFASAYENVCDQTECIWRKDCFELANKQNKH